MATTTVSCQQRGSTGRATRAVAAQRRTTQPKATSIKSPSVTRLPSQLYRHRRRGANGMAAGAERVGSLKPRAALLNTGAGVPSRGGNNGAFDLVRGNPSRIIANVISLVSYSLHLLSTRVLRSGRWSVVRRWSTSPRPRARVVDFRQPRQPEGSCFVTHTHAHQQHVQDLSTPFSMHLATA